MDWISVEKDLPEEGAWVPCWTDKDAWFVGYIDDEEVWHCLTPLRPLGKVTKFAYITPPEVKKDD